MPADYGKSTKAKATKLHSLSVRTRDNYTCRWLEKELGRKFLDDLLDRGVPGVKVDWNTEVDRLQIAIDALSNA